MKSTGNSSDSDDEDDEGRGEEGREQMGGRRDVAGKAEVQQMQTSPDGASAAQPASAQRETEREGYVAVGKTLLEATVIEAPQATCHPEPRSLLGFDINNPSPASRKGSSDPSNMAAGGSTGPFELDIVSRPPSLVDELGSSLGLPSRPRSDESEYFTAGPTPVGGGSRAPSRESALDSARRGPRGGKVEQTARMMDEISKLYQSAPLSRSKGMQRADRLGTDREAEARGAGMEGGGGAPRQVEERMFAVSGKHLTGSQRARAAIHKLEKQDGLPEDHGVKKPRDSAGRVEHGLLQVYGGWRDLESSRDHEVARRIKARHCFFTLVVSARHTTEKQCAAGGVFARGAVA